MIPPWLYFLNHYAAWLQLWLALSLFACQIRWITMFTMFGIFGKWIEEGHGMMEKMVAL